MWFARATLLLVQGMYKTYKKHCVFLYILCTLLCKNYIYLQVHMYTVHILVCMYIHQNVYTFWETEGAIF